MNQRVNGGMGFCGSLNTNGELAWGEAFIQLGYIEMYRATRDRAYLDSFIEHFDKVLASRDDRHRRIDYYRKAPVAGWGSNEFSKNHWHVWAVHTGVICLAPAEFVRTVRGVRKLRQAYGAKADEYLARITESFAAHDRDWREGPNPGEGYYVDPSIDSFPLPLNQQNALGSVCVELYQITRDHQYKDRAAKLALFFKNRVRKTPDGAYEWFYRPPADATGGECEDISHASINVDFATRCRWAHIVFNQKDMIAFSKTWTTKVRRGPGEFANTICGQGGPNTHMPQAVGRWLDLCQFDKTILADARKAFASVDEEKANGANMLGIAKLARWERQIRQKGPQTQDPEPDTSDEKGAK